jgi:formylglycine-generating enzyme required for sulfatase activity/tRNA A-37 threonylcarbamoyl transferase component Bud32
MWQANQTIKNDRFLIQEVLGRGGFGVVYRALDRKNNQQVVIKTLNHRQQNKSDFEQQQEKFVNEAMVLKGLRHQHIVQVYELIQEDGLWGMVMEYINGQELETYMERHGKLTEQQALAYIQQMGKALIYIHTQNEPILHRDIKPSNIMLRPGNLEAVLIDFGLAREFIEGKTLNMTTFLTPAYAPLEQYKRQGVFGPYTDVYALAATLYHLVTGEAPRINAKVRQEAQEKRKAIDHFLWDKIPQGVSERTKQGIVKGMAVLPADRSQTMGEFLQLLGLETDPSVQFQPTYQPQPILTKPSQEVNIPKLTKFQFISVNLNKNGEIIDRPKSSAEIFTEDLSSGVQLRMVKIPTGKFLMGSLANERGLNYETPQHQVNVPEFYLGQTLVTQAQWQVIMGNNPANFQGNDKLPVEYVSWLDSMNFCKKLSKKTGRTYKLPSEAQWEYACRGGNTTPFAFGETITPVVVNYHGNYPYGGATKGENRQKTTPVYSFPPNLFGLYDLHGNVWEWCLDEWFDSYNGAPIDGTARSDINDLQDGEKKRLMRGGSWYGNATYCRSAYRNYNAASNCDYNIGFRIVCVPSITA